MKIKLIRDKLAEEIIEKEGPDRIISIDSPEDHSRLLRKKVLEEAQEVYDSVSKDELTKEIADLREVLQELMRQWKIDDGDVASAMIMKRMERGGFRVGYALKLE